MARPDGLNCPECRAYFEPKRSDQFYCCAKCNKAGEARALQRARRIYRALYHLRLWIAGKGRVNVAANWRFICREVASWIREDRERQRLPPPPHNHDADRGHERAPQGLRL